jgi:hypothetical protein
MFVLLFRGAIAPFTASRGSNPRNREQKRRVDCVQVETGGMRSDTAFRGARDASGGRRLLKLTSWNAGNSERPIV